ncbi:MAG: glycosyltransferase family 2 protein [Anaerolineae bacterium]|nr:glycosyltransferase family 2 protein [Anaerolineae bacterium]
MIATQYTQAVEHRILRPALSIVIPAYNEERGLPGVLDQLTRLFADQPDCEIIIVDDGSNDQTTAVARRYAQVRVIVHRLNRGYGAALKSGIRHARNDLICITDADGTYPNQRIPDLVSTLVEKEYDMVVGARIGENVHIPWTRKPAKWFLGKLANFVAGEPIPDLNSGMRVFRRSTALRFFRLLPDGFSFTTTITLGMLTNNYLVDYVPIDYHPRIGQSKIRPIHDTLNFTQLVLRIALYFAPLKIFMPLSLLVMVGAVVWAFFSMVVFKALADVSTVVLAMAGIEIALLGLIAELINRRVPNTYRDDDD